MTDELDPQLTAVLARLRDNDDEPLWRLVVPRLREDAERVLDSLPHPPRQLVLGFARLRPRHPRLHPDEAAFWRLHWSRGREGPWEAVGEAPLIKRKRGHFTCTVCVPGGTRRLAYVDVTVLWRPRAPWAPPTETEIGRQSYRFERDPDGAWQYRSSREL